MPRYVVFRLAAPLASFGEVAVGERRPTADRPTRSAVIGLLGAALGAATGAWFGSLRDVGISDAFIRDIREKVTPRDRRTSEARALLGGALLGQKKYAEAEPLLLAGYRGMRAVRMPPAAVGPCRLHEALDWLIELADARADKAAAARWREERGGGRE